MKLKFLLILALVSTGWAQINNGGSGGGAVNGSSGLTGVSPTQPAFLVTASPYSAKCDGSTDDTTAIQGAITAASTAHGTVIWPQGQCNISSALTVAAGTTNLTLQGQPGFGSKIIQTTAGADIIDFNGTVGSPINTITVNNLIVGRSVQFTGTPVGLNFAHCLNCIMYYVQAFDSSTNFQTATGSNNTWTYITSGQSNSTTIANAVLVSGVTNSLFIDSVVASGTHTVGLNFTGSAIDTFVYHITTGGSTSTPVSISVSASDMHLMQPILDSCFVNCINIANSAGSPNNIEIVDCWCNTAATAGATPVVVSASSGVHIIGGTFQERSSTGVNAIYFNNTTTNSSVIGADVSNAGGNNVSSGIVIGASSTGNLVSGNTVSATTGHGWNNAIYLGSAGANNSITGNIIRGFAVAGLTIDSAASAPDTFSGNIVDPANVTTPVLDLLAGQVYVGNTLISGVVGDARGYKSTAAITGPVPVKWDTSNANQVVVTTTADAGVAGTPIGVCANSPGIAGSCLVMTTGTVPLKLGTGTCAIGQYVVVDSTTNGDVKCVNPIAISTCSATPQAGCPGTVIGTAQAADSTVGTAFNVNLGLR